MPEQGKAEQPTVDGRAESLDCDLGHHHRQPDQSGGDVQAVTADKGEIRGKESAALWGRAARDHVGELTDLETDECGTEHERDQSKEVRIESSLRTDRQRHHPARVARGEQTGSLDRDADLAEQLRPAGPPAVACTSTAYAANSAENITMSLSRKTQKPKPTTTRFGA